MSAPPRPFLGGRRFGAQLAGVGALDAGGAWRRAGAETLTSARRRGHQGVRARPRRVRAWGRVSRQAAASVGRPGLHQPISRRRRRGGVRRDERTPWAGRRPRSSIARRRRARRAPRPGDSARTADRSGERPVRSPASASAAAWSAKPPADARPRPRSTFRRPRGAVGPPAVGGGGGWRERRQSMRFYARSSSWSGVSPSRGWRSHGVAPDSWPGRVRRSCFCGLLAHGSAPVMALQTGVMAPTP
jgi:hypothetical protein